MSHAGPLISVIIPVFNGADHIAEAIDSVVAQSYSALEIIVIDDGSTDKTADIVKGYGPRVRYEYQRNQGSSVARNHGVSLARGEFLAFLDADDLWSADKLALQLAAFRSDPALDLVYGHVKEFEHGGRDALADTPSLPGHHPGAVLVKRRAYDRIGGFSEEFQQAEVVDWMARAMERGISSVVIPEVVMYRRIHGANKGRNNPDAKLQYLQVLKRHLDRRRKAE
jgi:glycosyltransferase involved in cell wall biosynthesis